MKNFVYQCYEGVMQHNAMITFMVVPGWYGLASDTGMSTDASVTAMSAMYT